MKTHYDILRSPLITEKSNLQKADSNKVTFRVDVSAKKKEIKEAVEKIFGVTVLDIHTIKQLGKIKKMGRFIGRRPTWKKAIVKLKPGDKIQYFEGV